MMDDVKNLLIEVLGRHEAVLFAYLFGSLAEGKAYILSDVDLAVYLRGVPQQSFNDVRFALYADISKTLKTNDVDIVVLNSATNIILLDEIIRKGIVLVDRDKDFRHYFECGALHRAIDFKTQRLAVMGE